ncbi:pantoate--beta-alanine ligase [Paenibacillus radicis (ex Gao et al. 2016)]|uniref:Pantothenate synthetase n=1 Tax=Paenibacillus radicis (ex Gao et al. 2016) TaxID=1737354 RepID=A0A917GVF8_9BACL|nr:pantoate--beta-alanine ligase [Paenibacillus radicis (ex Gao et al. 2016)]GGG58497.1 pantoate--beta-alanine ligase [Paenibacillus radicis (ex Gao et al. 2016)]
MIVCRTIAELRTALIEGKSQLSGGNASVGLVPTMGYLHEGHASLMRKSAEENGLTVLSIFVNPLQFGPNEDFERYPRNEERDLALAEQNGIDIAFLPSVDVMYPTKPLTTVLVNQLTDRLCGASRPGHFDGVGTVVSKLFHLVQPDRAYFGMKDAQQVAVIQQMTDDLNFPVTIVPCPTLREPDGLALSSRNVYLTAEQRQQATVLSQSLDQAGEWVNEPEMNAEELVKRVTDKIQQAPLGEIDYVEWLRYPSLQPMDSTEPIRLESERYILALAVKFGSTRLIDNHLFGSSGGDYHV